MCDVLGRWRSTKMRSRLKTNAMLAPGLRVMVPGRAQTKGSARAYTRRKRDGSVGVGVTNDNRRAATWAALVAFHARAAMARDRVVAVRGGEAVDLQVEIVYARPRTGVGRRRPSPTVPPDVDKVLRCLCDALNGIAWADDAQVTRVVVSKRYAAAGEGEHVKIRTQIEGRQDAALESTAEDAGEDYGRNGASGANCDFRWFLTRESTDAWERGRDRALAERRRAR